MSANELAISFVGPGEVLSAGIAMPIVAIFVVALTVLASFIPKGQARCFSWGWAFVLSMGLRTIVLVTRHPSRPMPLDWITWLLMVLANSLIKLSAAFLYRRLFVVNKNSSFDIITKVFIFICSLWTVAFLSATIFGCGKHFTNPWKPLIYIAECNTNTRLDGLMISDFLTDILVWILPIPVVWRLRMPTSQKLYITGVLLLAAVLVSFSLSANPLSSLAATIVRLMVQLQISNGGYAAHTDVDLTLTILLYWSMIESGLSLIAACLPTLHYLLGRPSFRNTLSSMGSLLRLDCFRSQYSPSSAATDSTAPYSEILVTKKFSQNLQADETFAASEHSVHLYQQSHVEDGY
ncbi:plasma membrane Pth11 protein [Rutstroemia sp. NJR-2017a WRK4]|nr:plasma membrane Pth11 protein [Rutstroemia sp. NJR-2017a WRK4]